MVSTDKTPSRSEGEQKLAATAAPAHARPCDRAIVEDLAAVSTRLSDPGDLRAKQINWGYAICDRGLRAHYRGPVKQAGSDPVWPSPAAAIG
jgi:NTE family protein